MKKLIQMAALAAFLFAVPSFAQQSSGSTCNPGAQTCASGATPVAAPCPPSAAAQLGALGASFAGIEGMWLYVQATGSFIEVAEFVSAYGPLLSLLGLI